MTEHTHTPRGGVRVLDVDDATNQNHQETVVVSVAEVAFSTAAATSSTVPRSLTDRGIDAVRGWWTRRSEARAHRRRSAPRRPDYFESAAMAREMYRL